MSCEINVQTKCASQFNYSTFMTVQHSTWNCWRFLGCFFQRWKLRYCNLHGNCVIVILVIVNVLKNFKCGHNLTQLCVYICSEVLLLNTTLINSLRWFSIGESRPADFLVVVISCIHKILIWQIMERMSCFSFVSRKTKLSYTQQKSFVVWPKRSTCITTWPIVPLL